MELFIPKTFEDLVIPQKDQWLSFYENCKSKNNFNIACIGPYDTCKTTIINCLLAKLQEDYQIQDKRKCIFKFSLYDDIHLQNKSNILTIFCQTHTHHDKFVVIEKFDELNEQNQQHLKAYIDEYHLFRDKHKVHFIIEASSHNKIKDIIKSRMQCFHTTLLRSCDLYCAMKRMCEQQWILLHDDVETFFHEKKNLTISSLRLFIQKAKLLQIQTINRDTLVKHYQCIDESIFDTYFQHIESDECQQANHVLFELYNDGYDLSDIFYFLYEYVKDHESYVYTIKYLCYYINEHCNGHYHMLFIVFFTNDIRNAYFSNKNKNKMR